MTRKDFYNAVIEANISEDMNAFADKELAKLAHEAEYRRNTPTKKQRENEDNFEEAHCAIDDAEIESEIFALIAKKTKHKFERGIIYFPFRIIGRADIND